jgi:hypothetical protein
VKVSLPFDILYASNQMGGFVLKSTNENRLIWEQRIKERDQSGMSISKWCKNNGINKSQYHYWKNQILKNSNINEGNIFAEITPLLANTEADAQDLNSPADFQIFFKSIQVTVPSNFKPVALAGLMKVLQEL